MGSNPTGDILKITPSNALLLVLKDVCTYLKMKLVDRVFCQEIMMLIGCSDKPVLRSRDAYCRHKPQLRVRIR